VSDNDATFGYNWAEDFGKNAGDILVGQAMESVPSNTLGRDRVR
jgi:hypothetical protein